MLARADDYPGYDRLEDVVPRGALAPVGPFKSRFGAMFLDQLDAPGPEFEWLISGWLSVGDKSIIGGPSQSGKSFLAIHAGMCIAFGTQFFGSDVKQGLVIYIAGEGARGVKKRLRAWRKHFGVQYTRDTPFVLLQTPVNLYAADGDTAALIAEIVAIAAQFAAPLRLIVIDTLATAAVGADENASRDMGIVMSNVGKINEATRAHIALVHHMNASGEKLRGSTSIYAALDSSIYVTRNAQTNIRTAKIGKQKDDEDSASFQFELMRLVLGVDDDGKEISSCVCLPVGEKLAIRREEELRGFGLAPEQEAFMRAFFDAEKRCGSPVPLDWDLPAKVRSIVPYDDMKRAYSSTNPSDVVSAEMSEADAAKAKATHNDTLKHQLARSRKSLTSARVIAFRDGMMWHTGKPLRAFPHTLSRDEIPPPSQSDPEQIPF